MENSQAPQDHHRAEPKKRAKRNRTLTLTEKEQARLERHLLHLETKASVRKITDRVIIGNLLEVVDFLPDHFVDLLILDPPYNLDKNYNGTRFGRRSNDRYQEYLESWFPKLLRLLKPKASVYLCGEWKCSMADYQLLDKYLKVQNRITWQREKGRGALSNWKNCCEDIWFATAAQDYVFNVEKVMVRRKVLAPYRTDGQPRGWEKNEKGEKCRTTFPSNCWDDISVPYWSMPENTDHPTQKPEKLLAKLILASSNPGDFVFDPFLGSGTSAVVAKKLGRRFAGVEINRDYCCWALERLRRAGEDTTIQGYKDGVFWERNARMG